MGGARYYLERTILAIVRIQGTSRPLPRANKVFCEPQAREVGFNSAQHLQVVSGRNAKCHDSGAHSSARKCWIQIGVKLCFSERTIHLGFPNANLGEENAALVLGYENMSVAEQHWAQVAQAMIVEESFNELLINIALTTVVENKDLLKLRKNRWDKAT